MNGPATPAARPLSALRRNYLSGVENVAQSLATMAPSATFGTVIPILIGITGNATLALCVAVFGAFLLISACISAFSSRCSSAGSLATYTRMGLGRGPGIVAGWSYLVAMTFCVASSGVSCAYCLEVVIFRFTGVPGGPVRSALVTAAVVVAAWLPAHRDIKLSTKLMLFTELLSVGVILAVLAAAMVRTGHWLDHAQLSLRGGSLSKMQLGFVLAFMMFAGFESTTTLSEEAKGASRAIPRAMAMCLIPTAFLYLVVTYCLSLLGTKYSIAMDQADMPINVIATAVGLPTLGWITTLGVGLSCYACALAGLNAGSRVIYSMTRDRLIWPAMGRIHPVNATPYRAIAALSLIAIIVPAALLLRGLSLADGMNYLMQIASFGYIGGYFLVCLALPFFFLREHVLRPVHVGVAGAALASIIAAMALSLYPIPPAPVCYLPVVYAGIVLLGVAVSAASLRGDAGRNAGLMRA